MGNADFDNAFIFRLGVEAEFLLPFHKQKWGIVVEPTFQSYQGKTTNQYTSSLKQSITADYSSVELPMGVRHYFFLNEASRIFADAFFVYDVKIDKSVKYQYWPEKMEGKTGSNFAFGAGFMHRKISAEIRYYTGRNIMVDYAAWNSHYKRVSLILGYRLF